MIGVKTLEQSDGSVSLFVGTGQPLVVGNTASTLRAKPGVDDPSRYQIDLVTGGVSQTITTQISGGEMGGLLAYRDTALDQSYNALGQLAITISDTINKQLGQGLTPPVAPAARCSATSTTRSRRRCGCCRTSTTPAPPTPR